MTPLKKKSQHDLEIHPIFQMHDRSYCEQFIRASVYLIFWQQSIKMSIGFSGGNYRLLIGDICRTFPMN